MEKNFLILLVEDDEFNYKYIYHIFTNSPFEILRARNGKEALELFEKENRINIILIDIKLPDISGIDIVRIIRSKDKKIPIICQTAARDDMINREIFDAGCNDILIKPFNKDDMINLVKKYVEWKN